MGNFIPSIGHVSIRSDGISFFEQIVAFLSGRMDTPTLFGWYHILCLLITIGLCVFVFLKARNLSDKQMDWIFGITSITMIVLEIYKQIVFSYDSASDTWNYQWYAFPFQFCASPMYVMFTAFLIKNEKVKEAAYSFMATYALFAGTAVMFYPGDVFTGMIGINIHTMMHHGAMVVIGVLMYVSGRVKFSHKTILKALPIFAILASTALLLNVLFEFFGPEGHVFNMFYISPFHPCTLPVLSLFYGQVPYAVFLMLYLFGFTLAGYVMSLLAMLSSKAFCFVTEKLVAHKAPETPANDESNNELPEQTL